MFVWLKNKILRWLITKHVKRVEVVDTRGRAYSNTQPMNSKHIQVDPRLQDKGKTLKIFID